MKKCFHLTDNGHCSHFNKDIEHPEIMCGGALCSDFISELKDLDKVANKFYVQGWNDALDMAYNDLLALSCNLIKELRK